MRLECPMEMEVSGGVFGLLRLIEKLSFKPEDVVVLTVSGRGDKDIETYLNAYQSYE